MLNNKVLIKLLHCGLSSRKYESVICVWPSRKSVRATSSRLKGWKERVIFIARLTLWKEEKKTVLLHEDCHFGKIYPWQKCLKLLKGFLRYVTSRFSASLFHNSEGNFNRPFLYQLCQCVSGAMIDSQNFSLSAI